jgi:hypothetical protein
MSNDPNHTSIRTGAFISEDAVRDALERRRRGRPNTEATTAGRTQLRRWSVAELIARAVPRPPAGGVAR